MSKRTIDIEFELNDLVYLKTDSVGRKGLVIAHIAHADYVAYFVSWGDGDCDERFAIELTEVRNYI